MRIALIIIAVNAAVLTAILFVRVRLIAEISEEKKFVAVKLGFFKIILFPKTEKQTPKEKKIEENDKKTEEGIGNFKNLWYNNVGDIKKALLRLKKRVLIEKLEFEYCCGFSDAAVTAVMYGTVSGLYYNIFAFLDRNFRIKNMSGDISPDFNSKKKHIAADCILRLTVADIIYIFAAVLPIIKNNK